MRVVLDTNIFISGIFWKGNFCSQIIDAWRKRKITLVSSIPIINELVEILKDFKIKLANHIIDAWKNMIIENSMILGIKNNLNVIEHESDNKFLETAIEGYADYIISQDKHLLNLKKYNKIKIVNPEEFLKILLRD